MPIHRYLNRLRLRTALEYLGDSMADLSDTALSLGFSSHSHFTESFRREFGGQLRSCNAPRRAPYPATRSLLVRLSLLNPLDPYFLGVAGLCDARIASHDAPIGVGPFFADHGVVFEEYACCDSAIRVVVDPGAVGFLPRLAQGCLDGLGRCPLVESGPSLVRQTSRAPA